MQRESIVLLGDDSKTHHRLKAELRGTCYRLLRAKNERAAKWLMERTRIRLAVIAVPPADEDFQRSGASPDSHYVAPVGNEAASLPALAISREDRVAESNRGTAVRRRQISAAAGAAAQAFSAAGIPILLILQNPESNPEKSLPSAIHQGADYILFAPYEQTELVQAIRTAMLNGPADQDGPAPTRKLEIALRDRMCSLHASGERMARLFIGAVEQLHHARTKLSWSEAENRSLRQSIMREELESPFRSPGLPQVVQGVAHDFSNLLEAAGAAATSVYGQAQSPALYREAMEGVMEQAQELLGYLIDLTKPQSTAWRTEPVDMDSVVMKALKAVLVPLREPQIHLRVRMGGLEPVWAHPSLVYRVLVNLLWNAVQAMPNGGLLSVVGYVRGDRAVLEVADTGIGIDGRDRKRVLQENFSTKAGHYGMGLTLVRDLIEKCGGEITFSSRPRQGSLFSIALPIARTARAGESVRHADLREVCPPSAAVLPKRSGVASQAGRKRERPVSLQLPSPS